MSVNVSLSDTPGVSAYFDGQPIQDQVDEEVRREEERQEKELRDLLASELEDFEDDFLSESNSDEDSVNVSQVSGNHGRFQGEHGDARKTVPTGYTASQNRDGNNVQTPHDAAIGNQVFGSTTDDDWMMRIQPASGTPHFPHPHTFHHQNYLFPNSEISHVTSGHPVPHSHESDKGRVAFVSHPDGNGSTQGEMPDQYVQSRNNSVASADHSSLASTSTSVAQPLQSVPTSSVPIAINARDRPIQKCVAANDTDMYSGYQVQYKASMKKDDNLEERFYLGDEHTDFFLKDGPEEKRTYAQLEILYRARGRELEDITWKLEKQKDESAKEIRILKHKLAVASGEAEGAQESLKQSHILLQQSKSELADASGRIRSLETQISSLTEVKDELIKKVQIGESTIENLSHQVQELQDSESLSRARNEHEAVVSSLSQRYDREILSLKEKLDVISTDLTTKLEEIVLLKKQLSDSNKELEQAQISRGETINRLTKSLEDSQKQCQSLLEHASGHEMATLRVQLQQTVASKKISEDMCLSYQTEVKDLKEQLNMFESASALGAVTTAVGASTHSGPSLDDSMNDLGIKKTLDFGTPHSMSNVEGTSSSDDLISSLRSELERCLRSNKQKRLEVAEKKEEVKSLREELQIANERLHELERTCANQKNRLDELDSLMSSQDNVGIVEAKFKRDIENMKRERELLLEDLEDHKKRLEELGASEAKVTEINIELSQQIAQMVRDFDADKCAALERSQRTLEEVHKITMNNLRSEIETRFQSEKAMLSKSHQSEIDNLRKQLISAEEEIDNVKSLYIKTCEERTEGEQELREKIKNEVDIELKELERKHSLAEQVLETERKAWIDQKNSHEVEINTLASKMNEMKISYDSDKEKLQLSLNVQIEKANESWRIKVEALTETLSEEQKEREKLLKEKKLIEEELETIKVNQLEVKDTSELQAHRPDEEKFSVDVEVQASLDTDDEVNVDAEKSVEVDSLRIFIQEQERQMEELKLQHVQEVATIRNEHKKEFENAARKREQKFQTELRYFLKEKEEKAKEKLDKALKEQRQMLNEELEERLKKLEEEHKLKIQLMKSEFKETEGSSHCLEEAELFKLSNDFSEEKQLLSMKIADIEKLKKEEIDILITKHERELVNLQEKFNQEMKKWKLQFEKENNAGEGNLDKDQNLLRDSHTSQNDLQKQLEEERAKWYNEAQAYIHGEIENAVKLRTEELQQKFEADSHQQKLQEKEVEKEIEARVEKCLEEEKKKMRECEEKRELERDLHIEGRVKRKVQAEVENMKTKFLSELNLGVAKEKSRLEQEVKKWKEEAKRKIEEEKETLTRNLIHEMDKKIRNEKQNILQQKEEEIKSIRLEMEEEMYKQLQLERTKAEEEHAKGIMQTEDLEQVCDLKERLQSEVDARSKACSERDKAVQFLAEREKNFFEERQKLTAGLKECRGNLNTMKEEQLALEEKCAQMEKRYKEDMREAKRKKDNALLQLSSKFNEEREKLIASFKSHISSMNEKFSKELEKVRHECEIEKASAFLEVRSHAERALTISSMQEPDMEATSFFELRDHYLETVKRIKDDVMNHVQAANTRAASTLKTEMRKQKIKLVKVFKEKCKASIKSILTGQVSSDCINSIEHSIDVMSEALVTTPSTTTTTKSPISTPRSNNMPEMFTSSGSGDVRSDGKTRSRKNAGGQTEGQQSEISDEKSRRERKLIPDTGSTPETIHIREGEKSRRDAVHLHGQYHSLSQLAKVDLDSNDSDSRSRGRSNHSSPASVQRHKSRTSPFLVHDSKALNVPPLDLSTLEDTSPQNQAILKGKEITHTNDYNPFEMTYSNEAPHRGEKDSPLVVSDPIRSSPWEDLGKTQQSFSAERFYLASDDEASVSPREGLKMIEARVRLANWASNGEMPWKSKDDDDDNLLKNIQRTGTSPLFNISKPIQENVSSNAKHYKTPLVNNERKERENKEFVRPGKEAENFITSRKKYKRKESRQASTTVKPRLVRPHLTVDGYSTDDSSDSHASLVTLEPDPTHSELDDRHSKQVPQREAVINSEDGRLSSKVDYDRIKAAILSKGFQTPVTGKDLREMGFNSDSETDSSSSQTFMPLPISTPIKKYPQQSKKLPVTDHSRHRKADRSRNPNFSSESQVHSTSEEWKTIKKFTDSGIESYGHQASTSVPRRKLDTISSSNTKSRGSSQRSKSVERPTRGEGISGNTAEASFPLDRSSITWTSEDHYEGGGMWRYRSLEDILTAVNVVDSTKVDSSIPRKPDKASTVDVSYKGKSGIPLRIKSNDDERTGYPKANPVQAMNSEFWARQSYEESRDDAVDSGDNKLSLKTSHLQSQYSDRFKKHDDDMRRKLIEEEVRGRQKRSYLTPTKRNDPPQRPVFSSEPRQATSFRPRPSRSQVTASSDFAQDASYTSLPRSFAAHVNDVRKSLEAIENTPFTQSFSQKKGKMKRSTSEQSLHLLNWDQDSNSASNFDKYQPRPDIDDLISVYSTGPVTQSHFDLHNFGSDSMF